MISFRETSSVAQRTHNPIHNAVTWDDREAQQAPLSLPGTLIIIINAWSCHSSKEKKRAEESEK